MLQHPSSQFSIRGADTFGHKSFVMGGGMEVIFLLENNIMTNIYIHN